MKAIKNILVLVLLVIYPVAMAAPAIFGSAAESKYARGIAAPKGKAVVYIYQPAENNRAVSPKVWLNNYEIGRLAPGSFTVWQLAPGQLHVRVEGTKPARISLTSQAGKIYLFRLSVKDTPAGTQAALTHLPISHRADLAATRLIKNPREVTATVAKVPDKKPMKKQVKPPPSAAKSLVMKPVRESDSTPATQQSSSVINVRSVPKQTIKSGGYGVTLKTGMLTLSKDTQTLFGTARNFDDSAAGIYAIEGYYQFQSGLIIGGEFLAYSTEFTTLGASRHDIDITILFANVKQYFRTDKTIQPFIGGGIGYAVTDTRGPSTGSSINGNTSGIAYQLLAGVEYRSTDFSVFGEFKFLSADTESSSTSTTNIDVSGSGFFAGATYHF